MRTIKPRREVKYCDSIFSLATIGNAGVSLLCNDMQQGTNAQTRLGQQIYVVGLRVVFYFILNSSATIGDFCRFIIFKDSQPDGATYGNADLLNNITTTQTTYSALNVANGRRFKVFYDRIIALGASGPEVARVKKYFKLSFPVKYANTNVGDITDITSNALFCSFYSYDNTNKCSVEGTARLRYIDA